MALTALPNLITLPDAAKRLQKSVPEVRSMVENGEVDGGVLPTGELMVTAESLPASKQDLPEYQKYSHLKESPIWISAAARKYDLPQVTISQWVQKGLISKIGEEKNKVLLDEQDIAYCAEIYRRQGGKGKRVFNTDGTPYRSKTRLAPLAS